MKILLVVIACLTAGCHSSLVKVKGRLMQKGEPVRAGLAEKLHVIFYSLVEAGGQPDEAYPANVNHKEGTFQVPGKRGKGIAPGRYRIAVHIWSGLGNADRLKGRFGPQNSPIIQEITGDRATEEVDIDLEGPS